MEDAATYQAEFTNRAGDKKISSALVVHCKFLKSFITNKGLLFLKQFGLKVYRARARARARAR
jgi:hypothetical protein